MELYIKNDIYKLSDSYYLPLPLLFLISNLSIIITEKMGKNLKNVLYISFCFLFLQSFTNTDIQILSQLTEQNGNTWAGPSANALLFFSNAIAALYNGYIGKFSPHKIFFFSVISYIAYASLNVLFLKLGFQIWILITILIASLICGVWVSPFYNMLFNYINHCSQSDNEPTKYFGLSLCIGQSANVVGNIFSSIVIGYLDQFWYSVILLAMITIASCLFWFVKEVQWGTQKQNKIEIQSERNQQSLTQNNNVSQLNSQTKFPYRILPTFCISGIILSTVFLYLSIIMYRTFPNKQKEQLNRLSFILFLFQGVGQFLGGMFITFFSGKIKSIKLQFIIISNIFLLTIVFIYIGSYFQNLYVLYAFGFIIGICNCSIYSLGMSMAGLWSQYGISAFNFTQLLCFSLNVPIYLLIKFEYVIIWIVLVEIVGVTCLLNETKIK